MMSVLHSRLNLPCLAENVLVQYETAVSSFGLLPSLTKFETEREACLGKA